MSGIRVPYEVGSGGPIDGLEEALAERAELAAWVASLTPLQLELVARAVEAWEAAGRPSDLGQRVGDAYVRARMRELAARGEEP